MPARDRILAAAFSAFTERGFSQTSTLDVATRAKVSKRELYTLFGSKQDMLVACITNYAERLRPPADLPAPRTRTELASALTDYGAQLLRELTSPTVVGMFRLAIAEATTTPTIAAALDQQARAPTRAALIAFLTSAREAKLLEGDPQELAETFTSELLGTIFVSLLLGVAKAPTSRQIKTRSARATAIALQLHTTRRQN
jgi:AcrR family transcriptional regulator